MTADARSVYVVVISAFDCLLTLPIVFMVEILSVISIGSTVISSNPDAPLNSFSIMNTNASNKSPTALPGPPSPV